MANPVALTHAFMRSHPEEAARVLESVSAAAATELFVHAPARLAAGVLAAMLPNSAASCIAALDDGRAVEFLAALGVQPAVAVLRHIDEARRTRLVASLPTTTGLASRLLLNYPEDSVGAWADPSALALARETRATDALEQLRRGEADGSDVYVIGVSQQLVGRVTVVKLLRAPPNATLKSLATPTEGVLAAQTPLLGALAHPAWQHVSSLPVVESGGRLLGRLTLAALHRAVHHADRTAVRLADETLTALTARSYWEALSGIVEAALALLPVPPPIEAIRDER